MVITGLHAFVKQLNSYTLVMLVKFGISVWRSNCLNSQVLYECIQYDVDDPFRVETVLLEKLLH